jgi:hypothetical protein
MVARDRASSPTCRAVRLPRLLCAIGLPVKTRRGRCRATADSPTTPTHFTRPSSTISIPQTVAPGHCRLSTRSSNHRDLAPRHRLHSAPRSHPSFDSASTAAPASSQHQRTGACSWGEEAQLKKNYVVAVAAKALGTKWRRHECLSWSVAAVQHSSAWHG